MTVSFEYERENGSAHLLFAFLLKFSNTECNVTLKENSNNLPEQTFVQSYFCFVKKYWYTILVCERPKLFLNKLFHSKHSYVKTPSNLRKTPTQNKEIQNGQKDHTEAQNARWWWRGYVIQFCFHLISPRKISSSSSGSFCWEGILMISASVHGWTL